jgi:hypothetical protein
VWVVTVSTSTIQHSSLATAVSPRSTTQHCRALARPVAELEPQATAEHPEDCPRRRMMLVHLAEQARDLTYWSST